jgi:hypothetical protein
MASSAPAPMASAMSPAEEPEKEKEEDEGPESPDSPASSVGGDSSDSDSDSSDEEEEHDEKKKKKKEEKERKKKEMEAPSPAASGAVPTSTQPALPAAPVQSSPNGSGAISSTPASQQASPSLGNAPTTSAAMSVASQKPAAQPVFTLSFSSHGNAAAAPQITQIPISSQGNDTAAPQTTQISTTTLSTRPTSTPATVQKSSANPRPTAAAAIPPGPAKSEAAGQDAVPQRSSPQEERTMITKGGAAAAITLSIIGMAPFHHLHPPPSNHPTGALAIVIAGVIFLKRRKRRQNQYKQRLGDDAFNPGNTGSLHVPETVHVANESPFFAGASAGNGAGSHLTRSTDRSESLFGAGPYMRPETVSTERNKTSRFPVAPPQQTPNPFADPPLNKAYDVLAGRPRSTTLTDRGSWVKNPFRNPESERFDPFGELQEKARLERRRYVEKAKREAEANREKEVERQFDEKEKMGLGMPEARRKGSGVTLEGLGVLDRSGGLR